VAQRLLDQITENEKQSTQKKQRNLASILLAILVADLSMSFDNIVAVGALAHGNLLALVVGLLISIIVLMLGSMIVSQVIKRIPLLMDLAALLLGWTSATMIYTDLRTLAVAQHVGWLLSLSQPTLPLQLSWLLVILAATTCGLVLILDLHMRANRQS
jgi:predicted tellurium resistance membrane protein TerC